MHIDERAAESTRAVSALAYTVGRHVVFGADRYAPGTSRGRQLLAHELTHVVQQQEGRAVEYNLNRLRELEQTREEEAERAEQSGSEKMTHPHRRCRNSQNREE